MFEIFHNENILRDISTDTERYGGNTYQPISTGYLQRAELEGSKGEMFNLLLICLILFDL